MVFYRKRYTRITILYVDTMSKRMFGTGHRTIKYDFRELETKNNGLLNKISSTCKLSGYSQLTRLLMCDAVSTQRFDESIVNVDFIYFYKKPFYILTIENTSDDKDRIRCNTSVKVDLNELKVCEYSYEIIFLYINALLNLF